MNEGLGALLGIEVVSCEDDRAVVELEADDRHLNGHGTVHGGAIATLVDTVVVPAVGQAYELGWMYVTVTMDIQYLGAVVEEDAIAEGWVEQRGKTLVFCAVEVASASGKRAAKGTLTYRVAPPRG